MNHTYRVIYNESTNTFVAVSEIVCAKGKKSRGKKSASSASSAVVAVGVAVAGVGGTLMTATEAEAAAVITTGQTGVAIGTVNNVNTGGAQANQSSSVAIGQYANANSDGKSIAIGGVNAGEPATTASGAFSTAIGSSAFATGRNAIAVGCQTVATEWLSTAIGTMAVASGQSSVAIGSAESGATYRRAVASGGQGVAIGSGTLALGQQSTAIGNDATAYGRGSVAIGNDDLAGTGGTIDSSVARGNLTTDRGNTKGLFIRGTEASAAYSTISAGQGSLALGGISQALAHGAVAIGAESRAGVATAAGNLDNASGTSSQVVNYLNDTLRITSTRGINSVAIGTRAAALSNQTTALGADSVAVFDKATAFGTNALAHSNSSIAIGDNAAAGGTRTGDTISFKGGDNATAIGRDAKAYATNSNVLGNNATALNKVKADSSQTITRAEAILNAVGNKNHTTLRQQNTTIIGILQAGGLNSAEARELVQAMNDAANTTTSGTQAFTLAINRLKQHNFDVADSISIGTNAITSTNHSIAMGTNANSSQLGSIVIGANSHLKGPSTGSMSVGSVENGDTPFVLLGYNTSSQSRFGDTIVGAWAKTENPDFAINQGTVIGNRAIVYGDQGVAVGADTLAAGNSSVAIGGDDLDKAAKALAPIVGATWTGTSASEGTDITNVTSKYGSFKGEAGLTATVEGHLNQVGNNGRVYPNTAALGDASLALGTGSQTLGVASNAIGANALAKGLSSTAIGTLSRAWGEHSIAIGTNSNASGTNAIAIGLGNNVTGNNSGAFGDPSVIAGTNSYSLGNNHIIANNTDNAISIGGQNNIGGTGVRDTNGIVTNTSAASITNSTGGANRSMVIGYKNTVNADDVMVLGNNITATGTGVAGSVILGQNASTTGSHTIANVTSAEVNGVNYGNFVGTVANTGRFVSVGAEGDERKIINLAAGNISATSTEAINGSQLYQVMAKIPVAGNVSSADGKIVNDAPTAPNTVATTASVADAVNQSYWTLQNNSTKVGDVNPGDKVNFTSKDKSVVITATAEEDGVSELDFAVKIDGTTITRAEDGTLSAKSGENTQAHVIQGTGVTVAEGENTNGTKSYTVSANVDNDTITTNDKGELVAKNTQASVTKGKGVTLTTTQNDNGTTNYTVAVDVDDDTITTNEDGKLVAKNTQAHVIQGAGVNVVEGENTNGTKSYTISANTDVTTGTNPNGTVKVDNGGDNLVNGTTLVDTVNNASFNLTTGGNTATSDVVGQVKAGSVVKLVGGDAISVSQSGTDITINTKYDNKTITLTDGNLSVANTTLNQVGPATDPATVTKIDTPDETNSTKFVNAGDLAETLNNMGFNVEAKQGAEGSVSGKPEKTAVKTGDTVNFISGHNIDIKQEGQNFTISATVDAADVANTTLTPNATTGKIDAPTTTAEGNKLVNATTVANAINNAGWKVHEHDSTEGNLKDIVSAGDQVVFANGTGTTASVTSADNVTTVTFNINTAKVDTNPSDQPSDDTVTINNDGKAQAPNNNADNSFLTTGDVVNLVNNVSWTAKRGESVDTNADEGDEDTQVHAGDNVTFVAGKNMALQKVGSTFTYATKDDVTFNNVTTNNFTVPTTNADGGAGNPITINNNGISAGDKPITNVSTNLTTYGDTDAPKTGLVNLTTGSATDAATVGDLQKMGWIVESNRTTGADEGQSTGDAYNKQVKNADQVKFVGTGAAKVSGANEGETSVITVHVDPSKVETGTITVNDGSQGDDKPNGSVSGDTSAGTVATVNDVVNAINNSGFNLSVQEGTNSTLVNPGDKVDLNNKDGNIVITKGTDDNNITFALNNTIKVGDDTATNQITINSNTGKIDGLTNNLPDTYNTDEYNTDNKPVTKNEGLPSGLNTTNAATVGDILNSGWNVKGNGEDKDFVKAYDTVDFINGTGTTAVVQTSEDGKVTNVTFNINTTKVDTNPSDQPSDDTVTINTDGKAQAPNNNADNSFLTTGDVVNLVNNVSWTVTANGENATGSAKEKVQAGDVVTFEAGKNMKLTQDGKTFTYATADDVTFNNVNTTTLTVGNVSNAGAPVVNFGAEEAKPATNNAQAPVTALNITTNGSPTQITGVGSSLNTTNVPTMPNGDGIVTPVAEQPKLVDLTATTVNPNAVATVGDLQNMGWTVSAGNNYTDAVKNADEVKFVAGNGITVSGKTTEDNIREITIETNAQSLTNNSQLPVVYTLADGTKVYKNPNPTAQDGSDAFTTNPDGTGDKYKAGDVIASMNNADNTTSTPTTLTNVKGNLAPTYNLNSLTEGDDKKLTDTPANADQVTKSQTAPDNVKNIYSNAATVGDVLNAGFNLQENGEAKDFVKAYDAINFVNGTGTTANITMNDDGSVANVTFNSALAYTDSNGNTTDANGSPLSPTNSVKFVGQDPQAPVTVTGATSGLTPSNISTLPNVTNPAVITPVINFNAGGNANIDNSTVATVGDLRNMGWVVSTSKGNNYSDVVRSSDEVDFVGAMGVTVTGETVNGKRVITISGGNGGGSTVLAGDNVKVDSQSTTNPDGTTSTNYTVSAPSTPITNNANGSVEVPTTAGLANATDVANAINNSGWNAQANGANGTLVKPSDTVSFNDGDNIAITKDGNNFTVSTTKDINVKGNLTVAGNTTIGNLDVKPNSTVNMGGNTITNVAPGTNGTDAVNLDQLNATKVKVEAGTNVKVDTATGADGSTTYTVHAGVTVNGGNVTYGNLVDGDDTSITPNANGTGVTVTVNKGDVMADTNKPGSVTFDAANGTVATVEQVAKAINQSGWNAQANGKHNVAQDGNVTGTDLTDPNIVSPSQVVDFVNGNGTFATVTAVQDQDGNTVQQNIQLNTPMSYVDDNGNTHDENGNVTATAPTNTVRMGGANGTNEPVQVQNVASGVRDTVDQFGGNVAQAVYNAAGTTLNNAASIGDIKAVAGDIHNRIDDVVDDANAGISSAMAAASLPQAYLPGKSMLTGGVASYNGQGAVAVGMSKLSDNGRWVLKLHGSADTRGNVGGAVGAGFHF